MAGPVGAAQDVVERPVTVVYADKIVVVSNGYANHLRTGRIPERKIHVVQNAIDLQRVKSIKCEKKTKRKELGFSPDEILVATAGRLSPEKGQADLILAFSCLKRGFPSATLVIIGDGPLRNQLETFVKEKSINHVCFTGFRNDIDEIMSIVDLFVLPSHTEGLPNVVLEAFAFKKPVVGTEVGGVPEIIEDGVNGFLVLPGHSDLLKTAISKCLSNPKMMSEMGNAGYKKIEKEFTLEAQTKKLEEIYFSVLTKAKDGKQ